MIRVGLVGVGFMGWIHYLAYQRVRGLRLEAIVSRSARKRGGDWRGIQGNFGPPGEQVDLAPVRAYEQLAQLLDDPRIDLVDICLPPDQHAAVAIAALRAGKHVLCEKPMALDVADANRMLAAARRAKKTLSIGHVLPFFPEYAFVLAAARRQRWGRFLGGEFRRLISEPTWLPDFYNPRTVGGPLVDLHIHDAHFLRLLAGQPTGVFSQGPPRGEVVQRISTQFLYPQPLLNVHATAGVIAQSGRPFTHGFELYFERATVLYDLQVLSGQAPAGIPLTVLGHGGSIQRPELARGDDVAPFVAELAEVARAVGRGRPSEVLSGELARDALLLCHKQMQSARSCRVVRI